MFVYCEFHKTHGHDTENCFPLNGQLASLARRGLLRRYVRSKGQENKDQQLEKNHIIEDTHETPILRDFNTIVGVFAGRCITSSVRKLRQEHYDINDHQDN